MKKRLIILAAVMVLALPVLALAQSNNNGVGNQKQTNAAGAKQKKDKTPPAGYEQIPGPWAINDYSGHMQIGNALWGKPKDLLEIDGRLNAAGLACVSGAFETRESTLTTIKTTQNTADTASFAARKNCLETALAAGGATLLDQLTACNTTYVTARKAAAQASQDAAQAAQKAYVTAVKACVANNPETSTTAPLASKVLQSLEEPKEIAKPAPLPVPAEPPKKDNGKQPPAYGGVGNNYQPPGQQKKGQGEPPQQAVDACSGKTAAAACSFTDDNGTHTGTCQTPPNMDKLVCVPAGGPASQ